jgi:predicted NUDIX family phosphoesterase
MERIDIPLGDPSDDELQALESRCRLVLSRVKSEDSEVRLPLIIEFSGSPKSGKSSIIGIVSHFFKRMGFEVASPAEGASIRTPVGLRDDWLSFNAWSGCYALQHILIDCSMDPPQTLVILDRGLFDIAGWMEFLSSHLHRISEGDRDAITAFFSLDIWLKRENAVFLFTADHETSMVRENQSKLTKASGSVMNAEILAKLQDAYKDVAERLGNEHLRIFHVDTSERQGSRISFQQVAKVVTSRILDVVEELSSQMLLVTEKVDFEGFVQGSANVEKVIAAIVKDGNPQFMDREEAEKSHLVQQIVPYAILENGEGKYFMAKRRSDARRHELRSKETLLVGGHAEKRDWDPLSPTSVFERCLRRELEEELIGIKVLGVEPMGFISDTRNGMGSHHLAFIHKVKVGGRTAIRRQAIDKEFGRESITWRSAEEIGKFMPNLDPWSQIVASEIFGFQVPLEQQSLFSPK